MNKLIKLLISIILGLLWIFLIYSSVSFYKIDFNFKNWDPENRFLVILMGFPIGFFISILSFFEDKK